MLYYNISALSQECRSVECPAMLKLLFVCTGNICRSPTVEGVFAAQVKRAGLADRVGVDSAGTHGYHIGDPPDRRSQAAAKRRGYDLSPLRARKLVADDFAAFDYLLAMDREHLDIMRRMAGKSLGKVALFLDFAEGLAGAEVPDPYYGDTKGFDHVLDLIEAGSRGLLGHIRARHFALTSNDITT